jgi:hypothetical protein
LLVFLVEHRGEAVHRRDIFDRIWSDVAPRTLSQAIRTIRRALAIRSTAFVHRLPPWISLRLRRSAEEDDEADLPARSDAASHGGQKTRADPMRLSARPRGGDPERGRRHVGRNCCMGSALRGITPSWHSALRTRCSVTLATAEAGPADSRELCQWRSPNW